MSPLPRSSVGAEAVPACVRSFGALKKELERRGLFEPDVRGTCLELLFHVMLATTGIIIVVGVDSVVVRIVGVAAMTLGLLGVGTSSHNSSHFGTFSFEAHEHVVRTRRFHGGTGTSGIVLGARPTCSTTETRTYAASTKIWI